MMAMKRTSWALGLLTSWQKWKVQFTSRYKALSSSKMRYLFYIKGTYRTHSVRSILYTCKKNLLQLNNLFPFINLCTLVIRGAIISADALTSVVCVPRCRNYRTCVGSILRPSSWGRNGWSPVFPTRGSSPLPSTSCILNKILNKLFDEVIYLSLFCFCSDIITPNKSCFCVNLATPSVLNPSEVLQTPEHWVS